MTIRNTINVTSDVSCAKRTIALKLTHHCNVPLVIWTVGQTNAMKTTKKYRYTKRGQKMTAQWTIPMPKVVEMPHMLQSSED